MTGQVPFVPEKWWTRRGFVFISLLPLWPVSLWFLWKSRSFSRGAKYFWTAASTGFAVWFMTVATQGYFHLYEELIESLTAY